MNDKAVSSTHYANSDTVELFTEDVKSGMNDDDKYNAKLTAALNHADNKINSALRRQLIPIDSTNNPGLSENQNIQDAAILYAINFILNDYYKDTESKSPAITDNKSDADGFVDDYITNWFNKTSNDGYSRKKSPRKATFMNCKRRHKRYPW